MSLTDDLLELAAEDDGWREWPEELRLRLRWLLERRANQATPDPHVLCEVPPRECERWLEEARRLKLRGDDKLAFLLEHGHVDWMIWVLMSGRGFGKTRSGAEDMAQHAWDNPGWRFAVVAPTHADGRDTCMEGESGLLSVLPQRCEQDWNRSLGELVLPNKSRFKIFSAEKPDRLRGPQHHRAWAEELAAWTRLRETWDMLMFGLRLGENPQCVITSTPRPRELLKDIIGRPTTIVTKGTTYDNIDNLAPAAVAELKRRYEGTRLGLQELLGALLEEVEGAMWRVDWIDDHRVRQLPDLEGVVHRIVTGVDPAVTADEKRSDETGIVTAIRVERCPLKRCFGRKEPHAFVVDDQSLIGTPERWARQVRNTHYTWEGDLVVGEVNNGGDLVESNVRQVAPSIPFKQVWASRGKTLRAEPVANLYEQGRVHHVGVHEQLEYQQTNWNPQDPDPDPDAEIKSPDRMDALVYALTELMVDSHEITTGRQNDQRRRGRR